jgi:hypothetical protein
MASLIFGKSKKDKVLEISHWLKMKKQRKVQGKHYQE